MIQRPEKVLIIAAHYDDETIGCGGTIKKWSDMGTEIHVLFVTNGNTGIDHSKNYSSNNIVSVRMEESEKVAKILGISKIHNLNISCQNVKNTQNLFHQIIFYIRKIKPNLVITHMNVDKHRDHTQISEIVREACWKSNEDIHEELGECHKVDDLWAYEITDLLPKVDIVVDISDHIDDKLMAMEVYLSQKNVIKGILSHISGLSRVRGYMIGKDHGEGFIRLSHTPLSC